MFCKVIKSIATSDGDVSYFSVLGVIVFWDIKVENYSFNTEASKRITKLVNLLFFKQTEFILKILYVCGNRLKTSLTQNHFCI